jgi:hypothetical protein
VVPRFGVGAITTPLGKVSTSGAVRVATVASALLKVMVSVETPPASMVAGLKALPSVGAVETRLHTVTAFASIVTSPFARALPSTLAPVVRVMFASARILPASVAREHPREP